LESTEEKNQAPAQGGPAAHWQPQGEKKNRNGATNNGKRRKGQVPNLGGEKKDQVAHKLIESGRNGWERRKSHPSLGAQGGKRKERGGGGKKTIRRDQRGGAHPIKGPGKEKKKKQTRFLIACKIEHTGRNAPLLPFLFEGGQQGSARRNWYSGGRKKKCHRQEEEEGREV